MGDGATRPRVEVSTTPNPGGATMGQDGTGGPGTTAVTGPVAGAVGLGVALVVTPAWRFSRGWVTLAHELGHALTAIAAEGRVRRIRIHLDTSGLTEWSGVGAAHRLPRAIVAWWGHPAPSVLGLALAGGLAAGYEVVVAQVVAAAVAGVTVIWIRSAWGLVVGSALVVAAAAGAAVGATASVVVTATIAVLWAAGGLRAAVSAARGSRRGDGSDAAVLAEVLWLPVGFWTLTMVTISAAATFGTGALLLDVARG